MLKLSLLQSTPTLILVLIIFVLLIAFYFFGHSIRKKAIKRDPEQSTIELGAINGILLGLLALLLAFTFSMASSRFDSRRQLVIEEANNIGTVILRTDIYPDSMRLLLKNSLREYVEARIAFYQAGKDVKKIVMYYLKADSISRQIWAAVANYAKTNDITTRTSEMIPALNAMMDITNTRRAAGEATVPDSILYFLFILCFCSSFLLGYDHKTKIDWVVVMGFAIMLTTTVYNIMDLDRPRGGLINLDLPNQKIVELRGMFNDK